MIGGRLFSHAFGVECDKPPKMFSAKGFAFGLDVMPYLGFAADATVASNTAVSIAEPRPAVNSNELQTSGPEKL
jgi:hypothetical protein